MPELSPTWSLDSYFPSFDGPEYREFTAKLAADIADSIAVASALAPLGQANREPWVTLFLRYEDLGARLGHLESYLGCLGSADAANEAYQSAEAALAAQHAEYSKLETPLKTGLGAASAEDWTATLADERLVDATYTLNRLRQSAQFQMDQAAEALAADLGVDGISGWGRLYDTVSGKMTFDMPWPDGRVETTPMSQRRSLLTHRDRAVRSAAFTASNKVWEANEDVMGAALNGIAGTRHTLYGRRGQSHFLDAPLHDAGVTRETIDAMFSAIAENYAIPRRILKLNAQVQGTPALAWYDIGAPQLPDTLPELSWERGVELVDQSFGKMYPSLQDYFRVMLQERWIENEQRPNKRAGAFATGSSLINQERIFMTYGRTMNDVTTLAHEVGHTWHSHLLNPLRPCAQDYPMTLAETASTFAESILADGMLENPDLDAAQRAFLIEQSLSHAPAFLLDIPVRFHFESKFYLERKAGPVPVSRIKTLMVETQREVFGETLAEGGEDPLFWASKLHFFITDLSFYNFPYTFGYLLSTALFQEFKREGAAFIERYETFLRLTGRASCEDVVKQSLGRDIRDPDFWAETIRGLQPRIDDYAQAIAR
ncbi:MAG: M3 family oligoendopeptidase [Synoicihabitans sp.]